MLSPPDFQTVRQNPYHPGPSQRWEKGALTSILLQHRLEKTTQWLSHRPCECRPAPREHQIAITLQTGNAMLYLQQPRASGNAPCPSYSQNRGKETRRYRRDSSDAQPKTTPCLCPMPREGPSRRVRWIATF